MAPLGLITSMCSERSRPRMPSRATASARMYAVGRRSASTRRYSPMLASTAPKVRSPRGSKTAAMTGAGQASGPVTSPAAAPANSVAEMQAVKAAIPARKTSHSRVRLSGRHRRARKRMVSAPANAARPCAAALVRNSPVVRPAMKPPRANPAAAAITPRQRRTNAAPSAIAEAGVAPRRMSSPKPSARRLTTVAAIATTTTSGGLI